MNHRKRKYKSYDEFNVPQRSLRRLKNQFLPRLKNRHLHNVGHAFNVDQNISSNVEQNKRPVVANSESEVRLTEKKKGGTTDCDNFQV